MAEVIIYTTRVCAYCGAAKRLFSQKGVPYEEIDVSSDPDKRAWLVETTGQRTVPQIFVGGQSLGGYTEIAALDRTGKLDDLLAAST